jgi:hypothetical protein
MSKQTKKAGRPKTLDPSEERLAFLLSDLGYSAVRIAALLGCSDKTAKGAIATGQALTFDPAAEQRFDQLRAFQSWVADAESKGYLSALMLISRPS